MGNSSGQARSADYAKRGERAFFVNLASKGSKTAGCPCPKAVFELDHVNPGNVGVAWHGWWEANSSCMTEWIFRSFEPRR
jgi:hypothetical protein